MHLFLSLNHSLVLKERLLGLKPTYSSSPRNLFFLGEDLEDLLFSLTGEHRFSFIE